MSAVPLAPEFYPGLEWVNSPAPSLARLRGRVVVLGFWHAGSAWCHKLLDDLRFIQGKHADGLSVFGIHSPKFEAERSPRVVQKAINQHAVRFPVANDAAFVTWQHYGIRAWPSIALLDAQGRLVEIASGEMRREELDQRVAQLLEEAGENNERVFEAVQPVLKPEPRVPLAFPSGLAVTQNHLYIADTGHHRVLECNHEGRVLRQFGSGNPGFLDGGSAESGLQSPRGLAVFKDTLYVADTGSHALRRIRLLDGDVDTLAGNGRPGLPAGAMSGAAPDLPLNAPWDVAAGQDRIYLAMAALHQVWEYDLSKRNLRPVAGSGRLGLIDGSGIGAAFAQPAGLALVQQTLYVADSTGSAIRSVHLGNGGVQTLVGHGLFDFGDQDGTRSAARLQYPSSIALDPRSPLLWIADTYNDALRMLRLGGGDLRRHEIDYRLHQPAAIAASPGALWVANTNAHEVIRIDLDTNTVRRLPVGE
jgi:DNA-binding beta-propeller fold protein YncE